MNSVTKFIYITMTITCWEFSLVQTDPTLDKNEDTTYPALELNADSKRVLFRLRDDQYQEGKLSDPSFKFLYFCPPQRDWHTKVNKEIKKSCLYLVEISNERKTVRCKNKVVPSLTLDDNKKCGTDERGVEHTLRLQLFYPMIYMQERGWKSIDMTQYENLANGDLTDTKLYLTFIRIYQFCFYHDTHETAFARYTIRSFSSKQCEIPQNFDNTRLTENDDQLFGLDDAPLCYNKENQSFGPDFGSKFGDDYLVEQMLVSSDDIVEDIELGTTKNYVNVSPLWKSLRNDWNSLHQYFKTLPTQRVMCGTYGKFKDIHLGKTHADEEQQQEMPPDQLQDSNTLKKPNLTLTVPLYWWKLITFSQDKGIVVIMPNYPKGFDLPSDTIAPLCEDVCEMYGWNNLKTINATIMCCRPRKRLIAKLLSSNDADIPKEFSSLALAKNPGASVLKKLWVSVIDLLLDSPTLMILS